MCKVQYEPLSALRWMAKGATPLYFATQLKEVFHITALLTTWWHKQIPANHRQH
jgi:hypothetical protein